MTDQIIRSAVATWFLTGIILMCHKGPITMLLLFGVVFTAIFLVLSIIFIIHAGSEYGRWGLGVGYWLDMRTKYAMRHKKFRFPMSSYGYQKLDQDKFGTLWELSPKKRITVLSVCSRYDRGPVDARVRVLEVKDATTGLSYYLGVPMERRTSTAKGAAAWTFYLKEDQYNPILET